jgi:hypothetical protein
MRETNNLKHGLYVRALPGLKLRDKRVERLARKVRAVCTWLEPSDFPAVRTWCELEYLSGQVYATLRSVGVMNQQLEPRKLLSEYRQLRATQIVLSRELGLTPAARMMIKATGANAPFDLPAEMIASVNEVGESRKREREAAANSQEDEDIP